MQKKKKCIEKYNAHCKVRRAAAYYEIGDQDFDSVI